jgi:hypothetical protein
MRLVSFLRYDQRPMFLKATIVVAYIASCLGLLSFIPMIMLQDSLTGVKAGCISLCLLLFLADILFMRSLLKISESHRKFASEKEMVQVYKKSIDGLL